MIDFESQSAHALLAIANRRDRVAAACCRSMFSYLRTAARLRGCLRDSIARHGLSDLQFATLVVLLESEPEPIPMAVLAGHTGVSRSAMTDALDKLEALWLAGRTRDRSNRRVIPVRITSAGREKVEHAIKDYLDVVAQSARDAGRLELRGYLPPASSRRSVRFRGAKQNCW